MREIKNQKTALWQWEEAEPLAKSLFCVWKYDEDFEWLKKTWDKFYWPYKNKTQQIESKIKLLALANIYYEFCHEAYGECYEILPEDITNDDFPYYHVQKLLKKYKVSVDESSHLDEKVFVLIRKFRYQLFEELVIIFDGIEGLYYEFEAIIPTSKADYAGWDYIMHWGDTYSNFW